MVEISPSLHFLCCIWIWCILYAFYCDRLQRGHFYIWFSRVSLESVWSLFIEIHWKSFDWLKWLGFIDFNSFRCILSLKKFLHKAKLLKLICYLSWSFHVRQIYSTGSIGIWLKWRLVLIIPIHPFLWMRMRPASSIS